MRDLPLQTTLFYAPCPEGPAACYLQALCAAEGYAVSWKDLVTLYTNPHQVVNHTPDLRATINALQVISVDTVEVQVEETSGPEGIPEPSLLSARKFVERSNFLSFLDSFLDRNIASTVWTPFYRLGLGELNWNSLQNLAITLLRTTMKRVTSSYSIDMRKTVLHSRSMTAKMRLFLRPFYTGTRYLKWMSVERK